MAIFYTDEFTSPRPLHQRQGFALSGRAGVAIPFGHVVYHDGNSFLLADPVLGLWSGVSVRVDTEAGREATVLPAGPIESQNWTATTGGKLLIAGKSYFLQPGGKLALQPPDNGSIIRVGRSISETTLQVTFDLKVN